MQTGAKARKLERDIQKRIVKSLVTSGWLVNKNITCSIGGWPDLTAIKNGRVVFVEVKRDGEKESVKQKIIHDRIREAGGEVLVYSESDLRDINENLI